MLYASIYPQVIPAEAVEESAADCHFESVSQAHGKSKKRKQDRDREGAGAGEREREREERITQNKQILHICGKVANASFPPSETFSIFICVNMPILYILKEKKDL